ncbi:transglutaminase family protein [Saccharophagus degradans]|uniref:Transglutaminase family protein n=1 Tax=Saccharophagus degradans TaxID=86304 RepID=A0AAW7X4G6_9GAMM|nr:transglutaminase family protein [Saccharophagus degradans]MBU2985452.1 transglutaminase family protein [Saccharophagus degradans]MDO6421531.1 transglutaminase family protein [Saccharophagus degradans]MDO6608655.1 transglutaminase family protein [Saccharophagus degradans]
MTIRVALQHNTYYKFDRMVNLSPHVVRLRPAPHSRTPITSYSLKVKPETHFINWQQDAFGNYLARLVFPDKTKEFSVEVEVIADMTVINPFDFFLEEYAEKFPFEYEDQQKKELLPYLEANDYGPKFAELVKGVSLKPRPTNDFLVELNQSIQKIVDYTIRLEPGVQTPEETLEKKLGSCRDSAWLLVQLFRHLGVAARFASGYLVQLKADEKSLDGPSGAEEDFTDLHAWCEVFLPGAGWVGLDPTSGLFASEGHIPLACTPDPSSAAPIAGFTDKCEVEFDFLNTVARIHEDPRVTKPYTEQQWQEVLALGKFVDSKLVAGDVRLTMGGEPTFVSIDDMESAQWNTAALGEDKLRLAKTLLLKLRDHFAPHGLLHYGQGKWYPGEEIPRWALGLFWRKDNEPLWADHKLLARVDKDYGHGLTTSTKFARKLAAKLGLEKDFAQPAYEDGLHYLLEERSLPNNIDKLCNSVMRNDLSRKRLVHLLEKGIDKPTGFVLPLAKDLANNWMSSKWPMRRERIVLIPGDSPMGLRLPLGSLPLEEEKELDVKPDPFEQRQSLASHSELLQGAEKIQPQVAEPVKEPNAKQTQTVPVVRTALCVESRKGKLHLFIPPIPLLDDYVALIAAIEAVAKEMDVPVIIEGYEPPRDSRLVKLLVTPDPGVIEVNIHPANNWDEIVATTSELYKAARESRLGTEKFMLDGRHSGTGGGNHVTLGAATPADSPFLRRPDLLRSFVTYWQHHPSLSYLFSGGFVGPTSQAPRADEGRDEMLYEMEIAFEQMPDGFVNEPWLVDRLMRNLLIDITGNTHRAEFCIDKLYSPDSPTGRLGILEFRGFEMPPHYQMSLVQMLLIRALTARFWQNPYKQPLVRWGTLLHDKFMLPHHVWADVKDVVKDLNDHGFPFREEWLLPFQEFRFPHYGRVEVDDIELELCWAVEPWHVLGEEIGSSGTARYVDSSVERLQVKLTGLTEGRHVVACNGRRVPLRNTGKKGEYVAGVRYRAWAPPSALHPTLGTHTPLVFDIIDAWNGRAIGGCTYHVSHPGGRTYETFPVNAFEAESRRVNRFDQMGHTPGPITPRPDLNAVREFFPHGKLPKPMAPPPEEPAGEYPYTLDLRRKPR